MPPTWFGGPPSGHPGLRQQQQQQPGRFHPQGAAAAQQQAQQQQQQQRMAAAGVNSASQQAAGVTSPHGHNTGGGHTAASAAAYQRSSPPLRGPFRGAPHMGPGGHSAARYAQQPMAGGGGRLMPPMANGPPRGHHSPAMARRMPLPPPNAMRPIPQQAGAVARGHFEHPMQGGHLGGGMPMQQQQHMMRMQQEQQHHHQQRALYASSENMGSSMSHAMEEEQRDAQLLLESQQHSYSQQQPPATPPERGERRPSASSLNNNGNISRSPSPPPPPPPSHTDQNYVHSHVHHPHLNAGTMHPQMQHMGSGHQHHPMHHTMHHGQIPPQMAYHHHHTMHHGHPGGGQDISNSNQRPSPAAIPENDSMMSDHTNNTGVDEPPPPPNMTNTPPMHNNNAWGGGVNNNEPNSAGGLGPLRESRLLNMPQKRLLMQPHMHMPNHLHGHAPHGHHPPLPHQMGGGHRMHLPHHHHLPNHTSENVGRMPMQQQQQHHEPGMYKSENASMMGGPPPNYHLEHPPSHMKVSSPQATLGQTTASKPEQQQQSQEQQANASTTKQPAMRKGPDITMDAASILLELRTSASPATVSSADQHAEQRLAPPQEEEEEPKKMAAEEEEEDDVPALSSSSSSLSATMNNSAGAKQRSADAQLTPQVASSKPPKKTFEQEHYEVPKNYPTRLALPNDEAKLNSLHCFLRSELLEIFVVERSANKSPTHSPGSSVGRVGLRCVFCAMTRKRSCGMAEDGGEAMGTTSSTHRADEAPMAVFYPKSIAEIYRLVTSWQRCHLRKCRNLPPDVRSKWALLRENDKSRGKTHYWITSAKEIGLVDCQSRAGGIRFCTSEGGILKASFAGTTKTPSSGEALKSPSPAKKVATSQDPVESGAATEDRMDCEADRYTLGPSSHATTPARKGDKPVEAQPEIGGNDATNPSTGGDGVSVQRNPLAVVGV